MIANHDRSGWFGASDTHYVVGSFDTRTFVAWWLTKTGAIHQSFSSKAMNAGTYYEHKVLDAIGVTKMDRQIKLRRLRLRVNLDGETSDRIFEVKTHKSEKPIVKKEYWQQAQVQSFATKKPVSIVFYRVTEEEYDNFFLPIDRERIHVEKIQYDSEWVQKAYLPRLRYLAMCLRKRQTPSESGYGRWINEIPD